MNTTRKLKVPKILGQDIAVQTPQDNRRGQDVSKSHKTPEKHVSKYNHKELQDTFQNCTH
jgi:hypothetical protein